MGADGARGERAARFAAEVDWSKVTDPYVPHQYGPEVLEALWAPERAAARDACEALLFAARGDGSWVGPAAPEVLPFLVEAAGDPAVVVRPQVLETITDIAVAGNASPHRVDRGWPAAWERAVDPLLVLLDDGECDVRAGAADALAQATARADALIVRFQARYASECDGDVAEHLVLGVGELARHAVERRDDAVAWLRQRLTVEECGEEPDGYEDEDVEAWTAWFEKVCHDVRLAAIAALRRVLPEHADPAYTRVTADAVLTSTHLTGRRIADADLHLGADLPGRLSLALALLRHDVADQRDGGLRIAERLMAGWRSTVPELLPVVAELVDDTDPERRSSALRILGTCGARARPWADRVAAHLTEDDESHEPVRRHALWALNRMGG